MVPYRERRIRRSRNIQRRKREAKKKKEILTILIVHHFHHIHHRPSIPPPSPLPRGTVDYPLIDAYLSQARRNFHSFSLLALL